MASTKNIEEPAAGHISELNRLLAEDQTPWYKKPNLRRLYLFLVPAAIGVEMTSGYDGSVLNGLQAVERWQEYFDYPEGAILGIISAMYNIGTVAGIFFVPFVNDRYGRKFCIVLGSIIAIIGIIIQTVAVNRAMLIAARFIMGSGMPFAISGAGQLISEIAYPKERAVISGLFHESWYAGAVLAAGITLGTFNWTSNWAWRLPTLFQALPAVLQLSFIWFVPESPRFLVAKDRHEEALKILIKYHAEDDSQSPFITAQFNQIRTTIAAEKEASEYPLKELFTTKSNLRRVAIAVCVGLFAQWSGNGLVSYYLARVLASIGITERRVQNQINLGLMSWNLLTGIAGSFAQHYLKRRVQWLTSFSGMTVMFACWTAASAVFAQNSDNNSASTAVVAFIFIYYAFYNLMMPLAYLFITEVFPYLQRSKGMAIMLMASRAGGFTNTFVNPIGLGNIGWRYYLVFVVWLAIETTIIFFLYPETRGVSLEEAAMKIETDEAQAVVEEAGTVSEKAGSHIEQREFKV